MESILVATGTYLTRTLNLPVFYTVSSDYDGDIAILGEGRCVNSLATCYGIYLSEFQGTRRVNGIGGIFRDFPCRYFEVWTILDEDIRLLAPSCYDPDEAFLEFYKQHLLSILRVNRETYAEHHEDSRDF